MIKLKKLMPLAVLAAAAWILWKFILNKGGAGGPSFWTGGNEQIKETWNNITGGSTSAWDDFWGLHPDQRNNPVTGNPIPDATIYPTDPYPIQTASVPAGGGQMHILPYFPPEPPRSGVVTIMPVNPSRRSPIVNTPHPGQVATILPFPTDGRPFPWLRPKFPIMTAQPWRPGITLPVEPRPLS